MTKQTSKLWHISQTNNPVSSVCDEALENSFPVGHAKRAACTTGAQKQLETHRAPCHHKGQRGGHNGSTQHPHASRRALRE